VISQRLVEEVEYQRWHKRYEAARSDMENREESIRECVEELEQDMELLCITGVEGILTQ